MHLYFLTRGIKKEVDDFITQLQGKYLPFVVKEGAAGLEKGNYNIQVQVRPIQLWEVVFPREHKDLMLTTCFGPKGRTQHKKHEKYLAIFRKILGVKKIPEYNGAIQLPINRENMEVAPIGIKEDYNFEDGTEAL